MDVPTVTDTGTDTGGHPPGCGAAGQGCCTGDVCEIDLACLDWGGTRVCGTCGGAGQACCPGRMCSGAGATCQSLLGGTIEACSLPGSHGNTPGGPCDTMRAGGSCGPAGTACIRNGAFSASCVVCGGAGQPCCYGLHCADGDRLCQATPLGIYVCR